jgi:hypothetical protein
MRLEDLGATEKGGSAITSGYGIALDAAGNAHVAYQKNATGPTGQTHEIWYAAPQP